MIRCRSKFLASLLFIACSPQVFGKELKWTHYGVRPLAMGNAYVAVADDFNALFYNPAGLARLETWSGELLNPKFGVSKHTIATYNDFNKLTSSNTSGIDATLSTFETMSGKPQWFQLGWTPHLIFPGFGLGLGLEIGGSLVIHRTPSADLDVGMEGVLPIAFAKNFLEKRLSVGMAIKAAFKSGIEREFSLADITAFSKSEADSSNKMLKDYIVSGKGVGVDFGMLFTPTPVMEPTLGLSVTDIGGTPYRSQNIGDLDLKAPKMRHPSLNTGISFKPIKTDRYYLLTSADVHAANRPIHFSKKVNFGTEFGVGKILKLQAGLHQGALSGGIQLDAWLLVLRFATYEEQLGSTAGEHATTSDRRYVAQLKVLL